MLGASVLKYRPLCLKLLALDFCTRHLCTRNLRKEMCKFHNVVDVQKKMYFLWSQLSSPLRYTCAEELFEPRMLLSMWHRGPTHLPFSQEEMLLSKNE